MQYGEIAYGTFLSRPNRFIAQVQVDGCPGVQTVHVKNTGRCRELLIPGCRVVLERAANPARKTPYDLIAVYKVTPDHPDGWLFNIDSQAPNKVVGEWLATQGFSLVKPEFTFGESRVDFYMEREGSVSPDLDCCETPASVASSGLEGAAESSTDTAAGVESAPAPACQRYLLEVKGCTLEVDGIGYFPDAPTERGVKHLRELTAAVQQGYRAALAFVIQMEGVTQVLPNIATHPEFGQALSEAQAAGVQVLYLPCRVEPGRLWIDPAASARVEPGRLWIDPAASAQHQEIS